MLLQILTGILLGLHYTSEMNYAYYSVMHIIREVYFGWCFRYIHSRIHLKMSVLDVTFQRLLILIFNLFHKIYIF